MMHSISHFHYPASNHIVCRVPWRPEPGFLRILGNLGDGILTADLRVELWRACPRGVGRRSTVMAVAAYRSGDPLPVSV